MGLKITLRGAEKVRDALFNLPENLVGKGGTAVRASVRKAAKLIRDRAAVNLEAQISQPNIGPEETTGLLVDNLVVQKGKAPSENGERQVVKIRSKEYPSGATTTQVGRLLEYGTEKREPMPWMRPAFESSKEEAAQLMIDELDRRLAKIWRSI